MTLSDPVWIETLVVSSSTDRFCQQNSPAYVCIRRFDSQRVKKQSVVEQLRSHPRKAAYRSELQPSWLTYTWLLFFFIWRTTMREQEVGQRQKKAATIIYNLFKNQLIKTLKRNNTKYTTRLYVAAYSYPWNQPFFIKYRCDYLLWPYHPNLRTGD